MFLILRRSYVIGFIITSLALLSCSCMGAFPKPLSENDEQQYLKEYLNGSEKAKNILIEHNLRLVAHVAKKYSSCSIDNEDIISIGTIGLIKGITSYDSSKKTRLSTYIAKCIDNEILMSLRISKKYANDIFLQEPLGKDKDGNEITVMETIPTDEDTVSEMAEMNIRLKYLYSNMQQCLTPREKLIINLRYGLTGQKEFTQMEISKKLGISRSYVYNHT